MELQLSLLPKQAEAFDILRDPSVSELLYGGAAGGGKTDLGCTWIITNAIQYPGTAWLIGRKHLHQLKKTTMSSFRDVLSRMNLKKDIHYTWNPNANELYIHASSQKRSTIYLAALQDLPSDPDFSGLGSLQLTGAFIDEASQISLQAYNVLKSRIRYKLREYNIKPKILLTSNPGKNFLYTEYYQKWKQNKLESHKRFLVAKHHDNSFLPESYIHTLQHLDEQTRRRLFEGDWEYSDEPTTLINYEQALSLFTNDQALDTSAQFFLTVDPSYQGGDSTVILVWHGYSVIDYFEYSGKDVTNSLTQSKIQELQTRYSVPSSNITIDVGGGYGNSLVEAFPNSNPFNGSHASISKNYKNLRNEAFFLFARAANNNEIFINIQDKQIQQRILLEISQLKQAHPDADSKLSVISKDQMKQSLSGKSPDFLDALAMRFRPKHNVVTYWAF